ncbi:M23 family metallopeptidase [Variovorax sp. RHLX14]|uniref:M23 family metallopeptidase n=1 Tax=Variovorax sp. RHLX14 TaxID=1259731 RepID=UPI003F453DA6
MIISPPFLPARTVTPATATAPATTEDESAWLARAMTQPRSRAPGTRAFEGSYPVSAALQWHNGIHLVAPHETAGALPVCAIADGKVIFVNQPAPQNADPAHPQNYMPNGKPAWTDNGCVIVEHTTDIGAAGDTATQIVYYSLYMHLSKVEATVRLDSRIYRKDPLRSRCRFKQLDQTRSASQQPIYRISLLF